MQGATVLHADLILPLATGQSVAQAVGFAGGAAQILLHDAATGAASPWVLLQVNGSEILDATGYDSRPLL